MEWKAPFVMMACVDGHVVGDVPAFDKWLGALGTDEQRKRHEAFVTMLATLHRCDVDAVPRTPPMRDGIEDELAYWERCAWASDAAPTRRLTERLSRGVADSTRARPWATRSLLWGDPRLGNVIWSDARSESVGAIAALIDWEGASLGPPEMDLGWYLALDALTAHFVGRTVPGFLDRAGVIERYEAAPSAARSNIWGGTRCSRSCVRRASTGCQGAARGVPAPLSRRRR